MFARPLSTFVIPTLDSLLKEAWADGVPVLKTLDTALSMGYSTTSIYIEEWNTAMDLDVELYFSK